MINDLDLQIQSNYFNCSNNQYLQKNILHPPLHTYLELKRLIKSVKKYKMGTLIADFGAGSGRMTIPLLKNNYKVWAIDVSNQSLKNLQILANKLGFRKLRSSSKFPAKLKFTAITGTDILHHVNFDQYFPLFYNKLVKGGRLFFSEPNAFNLAWYIYLPLFHNWEVEKKIVQCSIFNIKNKLKQYGFKDIRITGLGLFPRPFFNWSRHLCNLNDKLGNLLFLKLFAYRHIIEASK